jgi:hypothetical protein
MMNGYGFSMFGFGFGPFGGLLMLAILVLPFWRISQKAGYSGWLGLLIAVPLLNVIFLYFLAFADWPNARPESADKTAS